MLNITKCLFLTLQTTGKQTNVGLEYFSCPLKTLQHTAVTMREVFTELPPLPDSATSSRSKQVSKGEPASKVVHHPSALNI